ncbi:NUDIX hydrolase [Streptomyces sp. CA-243310]|uniref:NUDIX hydrolase n=1 Tax=Streptomyces sp. CA-243310 TaxID=3240056 RepID=UPI003D8E0D11
MVYLVCFDDLHRMGLVQYSPGLMSLPMGACAPGESYRAAACRLAAGLAFRFGGTVARLDGVSPGDGAHRKARLFTMHVEGGPGPSQLWLPWRQALGEVAHLGIPEFEPFLEGYLEGWIPDGWITLTSDRRN